MNVEILQSICKKLPHVTEDIKWGNDLCFLIAGKMFCVAGLQSPLMVSFKVKDEEFEELSNSEGIIPAPYVARYKWIQVQDSDRFRIGEWEHYISQSYQLVKEKLPQKLLKKYGFRI